MRQCEYTSVIVTITRRGWGDTAIQASLKAGAEGGTIMLGRGVGIHEKQKFMGIPIEPEKEIVLTLVAPDKVETVLDAIVEAVELDKPGAGLAFIVPLERVVCVVHAATKEA